MASVMGQARKRSVTRVLRQGAVCAVAAAFVWSTGLVGGAAATVEEASAEQWYLKPMHAEELLKVTKGEGIKVAVIDTGVNTSLPSLKGQVLKGYDATEVAGDETDDYTGHGTTMAELIAGTGASGGLRGLAPGVKIIPFRIADPEFRNEQRGVNASDIPDAIRAAADSNAQIISMSYGTPYFSAETKEATEYAHSKGKLFFAPTGNSAKEGNKPEYPAGYPDVVGVASSDRNGKVSEYSQHGENVDIAAPGDDIPGWCDETFTKYCGGDGGTSSATAITSASAALIWSEHPEWTANQVLRAMFDTASRDWADGTRSVYLGHGLVRPRQIILEKKGNPGAPDVSPLTNEKRGGDVPLNGAPASSAPASSQAPQDKPDSAAPVAGSSSESSDDSSLPGWVIGAIAAAVVIGGGAFAAVRKLRSA